MENLPKTKLTAQQLRAMLAYDLLTGTFTRKVSTRGRSNIGHVAGCKAQNGYIMISVAGKVYLAHRLAWLHAKGDWPVGQIDHIDGCRSNNCIANLRDVSKSVNSQNQRRAQKNSTHGFLGVRRNGKQWDARIRAGGQRHLIGTYATPELAHAAYLDAKRTLHAGCTI